MIQINVLVIGGSGFIGSHIVDELIKKKYDVKIFDIKSPYQKNIEFIKGDITSLIQLKKSMKNIDYVYHLAGLSDINKIINNSLKAVDLNIMSTIKILESCRSSNIERIIFTSSYFVNSNRGHLYTTTKKTSELFCKDYYRLYELQFTILRYGTVYGPRNRGEDIISIFVKKALNHQNLIIKGDGNQSRNFIYVTDVAAGSVISLNKKAKNKTYTIDGLQQIKIKKVAELIRNLIDKNIDIKFTKKRKDDFLGKFPSNKIEKELGWKPEISFENGLKKYIKWYKNYVIYNEQ